MLKLLVWIIFIILFALFIAFNVYPKVTVTLFPGASLQDIPLALVIIFSFILGLLSGLLVIYPKLLRFQLKIHQLEKKVRELERSSQSEGIIGPSNQNS